MAEQRSYSEAFALTKHRSGRKAAMYNDAHEDDEKLEAGCDSRQAGEGESKGQG